MNLEQEIQAIKDRNVKVEADKAWETSLFRITSVGILTYIIMGVTFAMLNAEKPWLTAFVPTLGFVFSTLSLPPLKRWWLGRKR